MEWGLFFAVIGGLILIDFVGFNRHQHEPSLREATLKTLFYVACACGFGAYVWQTHGPVRGLEFYTGYALELCLSFDNVFVISLIMTSLAVPKEYRNRLLFLGIAGAIVLRGLFISTGAFLVNEFRWVLVIFGVFLLYTGGKMLVDILRGGDKDDYNVEDSRMLKFLRRYVPLTQGYHGSAFFYKGAATPMFVALVLVETADLVFAVDSIPAIFAVTTDPFVVYTSNIFAIVGLRSMFFVLEAMVHRFEHLSKALSVVLAFIGAKVLSAELLGYHLPVAWSLSAVLAILTTGVVWSLVKTRQA